MRTRISGRLVLAMAAAAVMSVLGLQTATAQERPLVKSEPVYDKYNAAPESVLANSYSTAGEVQQQICEMDKLSPEMMAKLRMRKDFEQILEYVQANCPQVVGSIAPVVASTHNTSCQGSSCDGGGGGGDCTATNTCDNGGGTDDCTATNTCDNGGGTDDCTATNTCDNGGGTGDCTSDNSCSTTALRYGISFVMYTLADGTTVKIDNYSGDVKDPTDPEQYVSIIETEYGQSVSGYVIKAGTHYYDEYGNEVAPIPHQADYVVTQNSLTSGTTVTTTSSMTMLTTESPKKVKTTGNTGKRMSGESSQISPSAASTIASDGSTDKSFWGRIFGSSNSHSRSGGSSSSDDTSGPSSSSSSGTSSGSSSGGSSSGGSSHGSSGSHGNSSSSHGNSSSSHGNSSGSRGNSSNSHGNSSGSHGRD